jgi:hypothetical protein
MCLLNDLIVIHTVYVRNDGIRSMHPLQVIREKCPQLVIDAFIDIVSENK